MKSIDRLVKEMTIEEKARYLTGASSMETCRIEHLEIEPIKFADGPH